jgi:hypothetical protein
MRMTALYRQLSSNAATLTVLIALLQCGYPQNGSRLY